jgi:acyl-CoA dehydrogenase
MVAAKTDPAQGSRGISLFLVPRDAPGFSRGRKLNNLRLRAQDTAELFFNDVRLPHTALLGGEGRGFACLMSELPQERLGIAVTAVAAPEVAMAKLWTTELQGRVIDTCLQFFGGYGYMREYPISKMYVDARVARIYGGTSEIMKEIIGRSLDDI